MVFKKDEVGGRTKRRERIHDGQWREIQSEWSIAQHSKFSSVNKTRKLRYFNANLKYE